MDDTFSEIELVRLPQKLRILDIFMDNPYFDFSKSELVRELGMSKQTLYKNFKDMEELGVVKISRKIGRATKHTINKVHPLVKGLDKIVNEISFQMADQ
jgi:AraC-like DNA-binding protein